MHANSASPKPGKKEEGDVIDLRYETVTLNSNPAQTGSCEIVHSQFQDPDNEQSHRPSSSMHISSVTKLKLNTCIFFITRDVAKGALVQNIISLLVV